MPSILVIEQESRSIEWIRDALSPEGWQVKGVGSPAEALQAAASEAPDLVLLDAAVPGVETLPATFSRAAGGPGLVALLAAGAPELPGADETLPRPFSTDALRAAVQRVYSARRATPPAAVPVAQREQKLTSRDIFGDMLAEVESEVTGAGLAPPTPARPAGRPVSAGAAEDVQRKLEQTLSGVFGAPPKPRPAAPPRRAGQGGDAEVDALLSKTLSSLELGRPSGGTRVQPPPARPPAPAAAAPALPSESTAVRRRPPGGLDLTEIEELARAGRRPEAPRPVPAPPAPAPAPAAPAPLPAAAAPVAPAPAAPIPPAPAPAAPVPPAAAAAVPPRPEPPRPAEAAATQRIEVFAASQAPGDRFGQYTLLEKIATGGMAEVWKARSRGVEGFQKTVAIKKILPHLTDNTEFIGMFIDEAKLAAQLSHPNIIHIYDLGKIGRDYYIAMEYVEGKDLRSILNAAQRKGTPLPLGLALLIGARLASALDYAHRTRDFEGRELGLVHRDVSPQNVLITYEGDIKLCDFGIAKAVSKANQTQMGALKGKLQYMSPEQAWGKPVDARSDLFSLGSILYELLTGQRLFAGDSEISVLEAVREGRIKSPRQANPAVPPEVEAIVQRALAVEPADRFPNAGELQQRLEAVLYGLKPAPGPADLAGYLRRLFDLETGVEAPPAAPEAPAVQAPHPQPAPSPAAWAAPAGLTPPPAAEMPPSEEPVVEAVAPLIEVQEEAPARGGRLALVVAIGLLIVAGIAIYFLTRDRGAGQRLAPAPGAAAAPTTAPSSTPPPAAQPAAAVAPAARAGNPAVPPPPAAAPASSPAPPIDIKKLVDEQVAPLEAEFRRKQEQELRRLEREIAKSRARRQETQSQTEAAPAPAPEASPEATPPPV